MTIGASKEFGSTMSAHLQRALLCAGAALALSATPALAGANADELGAARCEAGNITAHRVCTLPLNKSLIIDLPADARDVLVSNPGIADVVVRTSRRIYLTGVAVGQTNLFVFDGNGNTIVSLDLQVERDISGLEETLRRLIPDSNIVVEMINDNIILWGSVQNAADAQRATEVANIFANAGAAGQAAAGAAAGGDPGAGVTVQVTGGQADPATSTIVNLLTIEGEDQVYLTVTVAEIERETVKQLGIDWHLEDLPIGGGGWALSALTSNVFGNNAVAVGNGTTVFGADIQALEQTGLARMLAEPTLTAISGETASFLAGGEFPVPVRADADGNIIVEYKPFGVSLAFSPVVLSEGRISLHVEVEVSELTDNGGLEVNGITLPGLNVRRTETTLEMPSGGALVMSGLMQDQVTEVISGLPGIRQVPVLGALFGSREFQRNETELVIIVTPYLVQPTARGQFTTPDENFHPPGDVQATFFGTLNLRYGGQGGAAQGGYQGNPGYILQ